MFDGTRIAVQALATHKLRTVLAMLGVFLGSLALTGVMHVSQAMRLQAQLETEKLGPNLFAAVAGKARFSRSGSVRFGGAPTTFTPADAAALLGTMPQAANGAPYVSATGAVRFQNTTVTAQIVATVPAYAPVRSFTASLGRFISSSDETERRRVCVLGRTIAAKLFGKPETALGALVYVDRTALTVVGIMEEKGSDISGTDQDEQLFVPLSTYMRRMSNQDFISGVYITLHEGADTSEAKQVATDILRARHHLRGDEADDFAVLTAQDAAKLQNEALDLVWTLGVMSSGISFMVGSLGILSIMILLVRSRRLEIGIRRAVGARRRAIVGQFLMEAGIMSGTGGVLGVLGALLCVTVVYRVGGFPFVYNPLLISAACGASVLLGLLAGAYPAWKASRVEVLEVLRGHDT